MRKYRYLSIITALLSTIMVITAGCGTSAKKENEKNEEYPIKSITIVNPFGAGGGTDIAVRKLSAMVEKELGQSVVVVNKTGGSGAVGSAEAAAAAPDGYTFLVNDKSLLASYYMGVSQTKWDDLESVCSLVQANYAIVTGAESGYDTLEDLINAAKASPDSLSVGVSGIGGMSHLVTEQFIDKAGISIKVVGFDGGSEVKAAVTGNQVACATLQFAEIMPLVESGDLRILGVVQEERSKNSKLADVPTLQEQGIDCTLNQNWFLWAPKGTDADIVNIISEAFGKAVNSDEYKEFMEENYYAGAWTNPEETVKELTKQDDILKEIVEEAGLNKS